PNAELLGIDIVIPDLTYLRENQDRIRAILLTHGHEDHIGALPYVLDEIDAPVYGTAFTLALVRAKLEEHGLLEVTELREMRPGARFDVGPFQIELIHLTHSLHIITDLAQEYQRRLCFVGRSMFRNSEIAIQMGRLRVPQGLLVQPQEIKNLPPNRVIVVLTGSQGEPMSALSRVAVNSHRWVSAEPDDEVVISARVIPGNEKAIFRMIDHLYRRGARVHYQDGTQPPVHVSGHGSSEELRLMLNLIRPKYFVPIHGEYRQLYRHAVLARELAAVSGEVFLLESGDVLEFDERGARRSGRVPVGRVCIDVGTLDEVGDVILKERRRISEDGIVIPILAINEHTGELEVPPEIVSRGFVPLDEAQELLESARQVILKTIEVSNLEEVADWGVIKEKIRTSLRKYFDQQTGKRPMILPVILEV